MNSADDSNAQRSNADDATGKPPLAEYLDTPAGARRLADLAARSGFTAADWHDACLALASAVPSPFLSQTLLHDDMGPDYESWFATLKRISGEDLDRDNSAWKSCWEMGDTPREAWDMHLSYAH